MPQIEVQVAGGDTAEPLNLRKRVDFIERVVGSVAGNRFVDCGCGAGNYVRALRDRGAMATGFEYQFEKLHQSQPARSGVPVWCGDVERIGLREASFDVAILNEVLEHVPDDLAGLREVQRILRPGGTLIVFSPNRLYPFETHGVHFKKRREADPARGVPHYTPFIPYIPLRLGRLFLDYWARNYWPWELRTLVKQAGFRISQTGYLWQTFENISGNQPAVIRMLSPTLRVLFETLERIPGVTAFGASQIVVATKP